MVARGRVVELFRAHEVLVAVHDGCECMQPGGVSDGRG
jgi:hypothetical protein